MPCGYKRTGVLKEHVAHYRQCEHPACKERLEAYNEMLTMFKKNLKGETK